MSNFRGIWIALVTPMRANEIDFAGLEKLVKRLLEEGVAGFVVCGTTGEAAALSKAEQLAVLDAVLNEAGAMPVVMGLAGNHQGHVLQRLAAFGTRPLAGILAPAPYYVRPGQDGAAAYFRSLADASRFPLVLYDIPYRTGTTLETATLLSLAAHPNIAAIKDCGGSLEKTLALIADGNMDVLAGEDLQSLSLLCLGGSGLIAAAAHIRPDLFVAMYQAVRAQQLDLARKLFQALAPVIQLAFAEPNPGPVKAQLGRQGLLSDELREPMPAASAALARRMDAAVAGLNRQFPCQ